MSQITTSETTEEFCKKTDAWVRSLDSSLPHYTLCDPPLHSENMEIKDKLLGICADSSAKLHGSDSQRWYSASDPNEIMQLKVTNGHLETGSLCCRFVENNMKSEHTEDQSHSRYTSLPTTTHLVNKKWFTSDDSEEIKTQIPNYSVIKPTGKILSDDHYSRKLDSSYHLPPDIRSLVDKYKLNLDNNITIDANNKMEMKRYISLSETKTRDVNQSQTKVCSNQLFYIYHIDVYCL